MSQPPDLKPTAQALCDAATLPGLTPRDVDQCESSRLKFICYAIAARLHDDPSALLAALGLRDVIVGVLLDQQSGRDEDWGDDADSYIEGVNADLADLANAILAALGLQAVEAAQ